MPQRRFSCGCSSPGSVLRLEARGSSHASRRGAPPHFLFALPRGSQGDMPIHISPRTPCLMILKKALSERLWNTALEEQLEGEGTEGGQKLVEQRYFNSHAWPQTRKFGQSPLWRFCKRHGLTRKKDRARQRAGAARRPEAAQRLVGEPACRRRVHR